MSENLSDRYTTGEPTDRYHTEPRLHRSAPTPICPECGMPEGQCYRICPTQDPFQGDQAAENADYEFNARYDDVRERYAGEALDNEREAAYADELDAELEQEAYYAAALEQDTLRPDMDAYFGQFEAEAGEEIPF